MEKHITKPLAHEAHHEAHHEPKHTAESAEAVVKPTKTITTEKTSLTAVSGNNNIIIGLLAVCTLFSVLNYFKPGAEQLEAMKVGGAENFALVKSLYSNPEFQKQQKAGIEAAVNQFKNGAGAQPAPTDGTQPSAAQPSQPAAAAPTQAVKTLSQDQIKSALNGAYVKGDANAKIVIIEYSDFQCPFCIRHYDAGTIKKVLAENASSVKLVFKNYPLGFHSLAQKSAEGSLCVGEALGADKYYDYITKIFTSKDPSLDNVKKVAVELGMSTDTITTCLDSDKFASRVQAEMNEGSTVFSVSGTPGNVILNTENGKYITIAGAYPYESFVDAIKQVQ